MGFDRYVETTWRGQHVEGLPDCGSASLSRPRASKPLQIVGINRTRRESYSSSEGWLDAVNVVFGLIHG